MWGAIKEMVYETPIDDIHVLLQRIVAAAEIIQTVLTSFAECAGLCYSAMLLAAMRTEIILNICYGM